MERPTTSHSRVLLKELIYNVNKYFLEEKANRGPLLPPSRATARTVQAIDVSERTVKRICSAINKVKLIIALHIYSNFTWKINWENLNKIVWLSFKL